MLTFDEASALRAGANDRRNAHAFVVGSGFFSHLPGLGAEVIAGADPADAKEVYEHEQEQ